MANKNLHAAKTAKNDEFVVIPNHINYSANINGLIINNKTGKSLKPIKLKTGYMRVTLSNRKQLYLHRILAELFIKNPFNLPHVNHIDENPQNNNISNLEWVTHKQNIQHSCRSTKSYLYKNESHYVLNPSTRTDFKRICIRHNWNIDDFIEQDSGLKRNTNRKYFYIKKENNG